NDCVKTPHRPSQTAYGGDMVLLLLTNETTGREQTARHPIPHAHMQAWAGIGLLGSPPADPAGPQPSAKTHGIPDRRLHSTERPRQGRRRIVGLGTLSG